MSNEMIRLLVDVDNTVLIKIEDKHVINTELIDGIKKFIEAKKKKGIEVRVDFVTSYQVEISEWFLNWRRQQNLTGNATRLRAIQAFEDRDILVERVILSKTDSVKNEDGSYHWRLGEAYRRFTKPQEEHLKRVNFDDQLYLDEYVHPEQESKSGKTPREITEAWYKGQPRHTKASVTSKYLVLKRIQEEDDTNFKEKVTYIVIDDKVDVIGSASDLRMKTILVGYRGRPLDESYLSQLLKLSHSTATSPRRGSGRADLDKKVAAGLLETGVFSRRGPLVRVTGAHSEQDIFQKITYRRTDGIKNEDDSPSRKNECTIL